MNAPPELQSIRSRDCFLCHTKYQEADGELFILNRGGHLEQEMPKWDFMLHIDVNTCFMHRPDMA